MTQMTIMTGEDRRRKWPRAERERILTTDGQVRVTLRAKFGGEFSDPLWIPTEAGRGFRFDVGHRSDLKPATIPI